MADIDVERKGPSIWPWVIGVLVLALLVWAVAELVDTDAQQEVATVEEAEEPAAVPAPDPATRAEEPADLSISQILESPDRWSGRTVQGEVEVVEAPSERLFWIEEQGQRIPVMIQEPQQPGAPEAERQRLDIKEGDRLRIREAMVHDATYIENLPENIERETRDALERSEAFLIVEAHNIERRGERGEPSGTERDDGSRSSNQES